MQDDKSIDVDIIINAFNSAGTLHETLFSVDKAFNNTRAHARVILIDNHSTDLTTTIFKEFLGNHPDWEIERPPHHLGIGAARYFALSKVRSAYFAFLDSDDLITSEWVKNVENLETCGSKWVSGTANIFEQNPAESKGVIKPRISIFFDYLVLVTNSFPLCSTVWKLEALPYFLRMRDVVRMEYCPDYVFMISSCWFLGKPLHNDKICAHYRQHNNSLTRQKQDLIEIEVSYSLMACLRYGNLKKRFLCVLAIGLIKIKRWF